MVRLNALVHEAWLRMSRPLPDSGHREELLALASRVMRKVLVDETRTVRREEELLCHGLPHPAPISEDHQLDAEDLEDSLRRLRQVDCRLARTVEMRFFSGLSNAEIGEALGVSAKTVQRDWATAREWLRRDLQERCHTGWNRSS